MSGHEEARRAVETSIQEGMKANPFVGARMASATFTLPPQIVDMLAKGIREIRPAPAYHVSHDPASDDVIAVEMETDSGDVLTFLRGPDIERT